MPVRRIIAWGISAVLFVVGQAYYFSEKSMVHISQLHKIVERGEFSISFVSRSGEVITGKRCICTSFHSKGRTMNIKWCDSGQIRKVRRVSVIHINGEEVVL